VVKGFRRGFKGFRTEREEENIPTYTYQDSFYRYIKNENQTEEKGKKKKKQKR
jgi:hypothetical protein